MRENRLVLAALVIAVIALSANAAAIYGFNQWVKWLEGWVRDHDDRLGKLDTSYVSAGLVDSTEGDGHRITGTVINFGPRTAINVRLGLTWSFVNGTSRVDGISIGNLEGRQIKQIDKTFPFVGNTTKITYTVEWDNYSTTWEMDPSP